MDILAGGGRTKKTSNFFFALVLYLGIVSKTNATTEWTNGTCGGTLTGTSGRFSSPDFPAGNCTWTIITDIDKIILLTFNAYDISCCRDTIELWDGNGSSALLLERLYYLPPGVELRSTRNILVVHQTTYDVTTKSSFSAVWSTVQVNKNCGGVVSNPNTQRTLTSPCYFNDSCTSDSWMVCIWTITVGNGNRIDLYFTDVQLEWSNGCYNDNVMVWYDTSYEPTRLCYSYSYYFRSNQNSMTVVLLSTGNVTSKGFSAYWNTVCERSFPRDYNGTIESPGFPDEYYRGQNCRFSFSLSTYSLLRVIFTYFHLPNTSCDADYISVYNNSYHQRYCHNSPPPDLTDISEIRFVSNSSGPAGYGFQARVSRELKCGNTDIRLQENTQHYLSYYHYEYLNGRCEWTVTAEKGLAIMMIGYISCDYDDCLNRFIKIYNGTSKNPNSLITPRYHYYGEISVDEATNTIVLEYLADNSSYFYMSVTFMAYNATGHNFTCCSTNVSAGEGDITFTSYTSPNINGYHRNRICTWTIEANEDQVIQLVFRDFYIESDLPGCNESSQSYLEIFDESQTSDNLLLQACYYDIPHLVTSTTRRLVVVLTLGEDFGFTMAYFTARYKSFNDTDILRDCGGDISGDGGDVSSPNYPTNYDNLRVCEWRITVENTFSVRVEVHDLHIVSSYYCQGDALLFTGVSPTRTMGSNYRLCGQYTSYNGPPINSANNTLTMRFVSDWQNTGRGFNASWRKVCDQTMDVSSGWIESPRYPDNYYNNMNCSYFIQIPNDDPGYFITFTFHNFHLQGPDASGSCVYDYLEVLQIPYYNPGGHIVPPNAQRFCGTSPTQTLTTYFPTLLQFVTDGSITMSGFSISFEQKISECGQSVLVGERGFVASPNHPGTFPPYINCTTTIQVEAGHNITLTFQSFFLGNFLSSGNSCWGWSGGVLQIFNGPSSGSPLIGTYCGYSSPLRITSSGSALTLIFSSNHNNYATGFNATYMSSSLLHNCGDTDIRLQENSQHYLYYDYYSQRDRRCEWTITAEKGLAIMMLGYTSCYDDDCVNRFLKIYNGTSKNESSLITPRHRYYGDISVDEATNAIVVEYLADNSSNYFYMSVTFMAYNATGQNFTCGSTNVSAGEGNITFTSYASLNINGYHRNGICTWTIEANEDQVIQLVFRDFYIESDLHICNESSQSYLEIFDESQTSDNLLLQACYYDIPHLVTSTTRRLVVVLTLGEDFGFTRASFTARYKSFNDTDILRDCGGNMSGDEGVVSSPNFPKNYDNLRVCEWRITVENTFSVRVEVHDLHIVSYSYCVEDALLFTGVSPTLTMGSNYRLCGRYSSYNGPPINSANNTLTMRFVSDWQNTGRGFNASWRKVCDQTLDVSSGWIESPRYPDSYYNNMNCSYFIQIPNNDPGYFIAFTFHNFHLQGPDASGSCIYDYLEVLQIPYYNPGGHIVPPNSQRFCGTNPTQTLTTYFPTLLQFVTDESITMSGFSISFEQKMSECGQSVLVGERGFVASPNHPGTFPPYINCTTTIQVEAGHNITLTFQSFFLGNFLSSGNSCWGWSGGVLQIFNGPSSGSPLIGTYCGYSSPPPITSSGSALTLIFSSNHNNYATGFNATYMSSSLLHNCGDTDIRLQENSQHYLYYDYYSQRDRRCEWTITAEKGLAIMMVGYISCDDDCVNRFLKIYNGTSKNESSLITPRYRYNGEISVDEATNAIVVEYLTDNSSYYFYMSVTFMAYNSTGQNFTCGSTNVSAGEGNITFTSYTSLNIYGYHRNGICTWTIEANEDQVIQLVFRDFHIESDLHICNESSQSYLEIFDESQTSDNLLLQACYYDIPHLVTSTTRRLVVVLTLGEDFGFTRASFTARYKSFNDTDILRDCGGNMSGDEGVVSSPNFPKNYDNLRVCEWRITVENTFSVRVEVHDLHIVSYSYCVEDALLFNGVFPTLTMGSNYRLCGHNSNYNGPPINSANNTLTMRFVSDWQNTGRGFNASWRKVCDQTLDVSSGWMESPRYPDSYYNNMNCSYFIQIPNNDPGYFIAFTFHNFHLQGPDASGSCVNDYLEVLQIPYYSPGGHIVPPNAQRFCGTNPTQTLTTYFPTLLQFVTDESITMSGFSISFEQKMSECGQSVLVGERGFVVSPNHPGTFPPYINCTTTIQVEAGQNITLTFQSFFLGNFLSSGNNCWGWSGGVLQIFNGPSSGSPLIGTYCGYSSPPPITSSGSALTLIFSSNHNNYATGFNATYMSSSLLHNCGDTDIRLQENSQHYLYYNHYTQRDRRCEWTITAEKGLAIMMLGYTSCYDDDDCLNRFLKIYNGTSKNESSLITPRYRYGDISVDEATNTIVVEYLADNSSNYFYMSVTFMAYNSTVTCGSTNVSAGEGNITFTSYASPSINGYHRNGICTWTIEANEDEVIQLVFRDFHIESDLHICNESSQSYLEIFDESQTSDNLLLQAGYYDIPHLVTSTTRRLVVVLTLGEDFGFTRASFTARYKSFNDTDILRDCGGNLSGDEGVVSSPNYPTNYDNLRVCEWRITVENTFSVRVEVHDLDIVSSYRCTEDSLLFTGVTLSGYTGPNYLLCGHYDNYYLPPINSVNNTLTMRFVSDWEDTGRGFNASWRKVCDKTLDASSGWIESPRYPANYYNNMNCSYLIQISNNIPGYFITFTFHNFNLQGPDTSGSCVYDYLEVLQVPYYNPGGHIVPPNAQRFCGTSPTQTLTTYFPTLLQFVTDESITMGGFSISFEQNMADCGETLIVGERGFIASPNHPGTFPRYINCTTTIQVEAGYNITLTFQSFFLGDYLSSDNGSNCRSWSEGVLQIYDGISSSSPLIGKYCGYVSPLPITSSGSALTLIFTSHYNYYATGFNATYVSSSVSNAFRDCGGQLNGTSNEVTSPRYPDLYPDNAVCEWIINGNKGDIIRLSFVDFRLQASMSCQKDSLEVRDGNNANAPVLYRVCGDTIPQEVTSTGNTMFVRFVTDGEITDRGFKAFWKSDVPDCSRKDCPTQNGGCNKDECYCDEGYELSATSPHTCDTSELAKVTTEITVNISVPPSDLFNSSAYDRWRRRAEDVRNGVKCSGHLQEVSGNSSSRVPQVSGVLEVTIDNHGQITAYILYNQLKKTVPGLWLVNVTALRLGSLIIDTDIVVDNKSNPYAVSFLVYALAALSANSLTIGELSGTVIVRVLGKNLDADSVCEIYTSISKCPEKQLCHADNGQPMCRVPSEDHAADQSLVVGLLASLSAVLGVIVVAMGIVIMKKNKRKRTVSNQNPVANDGQYPRNAFGEPVLFARATAFNSLRNPFSGNKY